ncbi:DUF7014 domain-containing protein [Clostridium sp. ETTB3]
MLKIKDIFNVFSKRNKIGKEIKISCEVRNRIFMLLINLPNNYNDSGWHHCGNPFSIDSFCEEILKTLMFRSGKFDIVTSNSRSANGVLNFLLNCKGEIFLDFIEDMFRTYEFSKVGEYKKNKLIEDINYVFTIEDVKFELTPYKEYWISEERWRKLESTTYPIIICKEDIFINSEIIEPVIKLLTDDRFKNANNEFLEGLEHYKHKRYKESIASCCCALESVMKIISSIKKWEYKENATGLPLIKNIIEKSQSPNWYEGIISPTLTIRNKLGPHGKGTNEILVTKAQAQLQINLVASQIVFLIEEYK